MHEHELNCVETPRGHEYYLGRKWRIEPSGVIRYASGMSLGIDAPGDGRGMNGWQIYDLNKMTHASAMGGVWSFIIDDDLITDNPDTEELSVAFAALMQ